ncbi:hypothetical protein F8O53_30340, partial [Enterobacter sp. 63]
QDLAAEARTAKIRSVPEAIAMFDKHKGVLMGKLTASEQAAIGKALQSLDHNQAAQTALKVSRALSQVNKMFDVETLRAGIAESIAKKDFGPAMKAMGSIAATSVTTEIVGAAFAIAAGTPLGLVGYGAVLLASGAFFSSDAGMETISSIL